MRTARITLGARRGGDAVRLYYGRDYLPSRDETASGGIIKFQRLAKVLPNSPRRFNILYLGSNNLPRDWQLLMSIAHRRGVKVVYNQNGVAYPGWHGAGWEEANRPMAAVLHRADYVFFQSRFCQHSAERFLGLRSGPSEVLYNAVDVAVFTPTQTTLPRPLRLLLSGKQYQDYPVEVAVRTLGALVREGIDAKLLITGRLSWDDQGQEEKRLDEWGRREGVADRIELLGPYSQHTAPAVHHGAHLLLHTKYNDPCPSGVIEAMACGLPVVYSASGGVPELVGDEAGRGVPVAQGWERMATPSPQALAEAVVEVAESLDRFSRAARERAVRCFDLASWTHRHLEVFEALVAERPVPQPESAGRP